MYKSAMVFFIANQAGRDIFYTYAGREYRLFV